MYIRGFVYAKMFLMNTICIYMFFMYTIFFEHLYQDLDEEKNYRRSDGNDIDY